MRTLVLRHKDSEAVVFDVWNDKGDLGDTPDFCLVIRDGVCESHATDRETAAQSSLAVTVENGRTSIETFDVNTPEMEAAFVEMGLLPPADDLPKVWDNPPEVKVPESPVLTLAEEVGALLSDPPTEDPFKLQPEPVTAAPEEATPAEPSLAEEAAAAMKHPSSDDTPTPPPTPTRRKKR